MRISVSGWATDALDVADTVAAIATSLPAG